MKIRIFTAVFVVVSMTLVLTFSIIAQQLEARGANAQANNAAFSTMKLNLGSDDPIVDPSLVSGGASLFVANQLFLGLFRTNDNTGEIVPELAASWQMSSDATVFTFTLRSGVDWTDGAPVTAYDVRYGILRSLTPATNAVFAYPLYVIQNAEDFHKGSLSDPNQVGIIVLDNTSIRFTLREATAHFPHILAIPAARALPAWAITAHPTDWTEPAYLVSNGPYKLTAWTHSVSMALEKNTNYYDAVNVAFEQASLSMLDDVTAWGMYLNGQLDSALVPQSQWTAVNNDPLRRQELHTAPSFCTYYYGFNTAKPPFDDVLVRKAFIAATNRQRVIDNVLVYAQQPALTFTPPGMFGYADDVGIVYNPAQAQQWLAQAGFPNGQGLPPITLTVNTSTVHQAIAENVRQDWIDNLGVTVALSNIPWRDYLDLLASDPPQVWRQGWCYDDYRDASNFLREGTSGRVRYGNWNNATYENQLDQAARTADGNIRRMLYRQAEEILVEVDAVMLPIYHYATGFATRPDLVRTYGSSGFSGRIAEWWYITDRTFLPLVSK